MKLERIEELAQQAGKAWIAGADGVPEVCAAAIRTAVREALDAAAAECISLELDAGKHLCSKDWIQGAEDGAARSRLAIIRLRDELTAEPPR